MYSSEISQKLIDRAVSFHGHWCPGLARGVRAAAWAMEHFGTAADEEIVTVTETDMCAVDAIQALVGCTFGKGNLIFRDRGKVAFTFYRRSDGKRARIVEKPRQDEYAPRADELKRLLTEQGLSEEIRENAEKELATIKQQRIALLLSAPFETLFDIKEAAEDMPGTAVRLPTILCEACGEGVMSSRIVEKDDRCLCLDCAGSAAG